MIHEQVSLRVPGILKYNHFVNDAGELLFRERIDFYADEMMQRFLEDMRIINYEVFANAYYHGKSDTITVDFDLDDEWISVTFKTNNIGYGIKPVENINGSEAGQVFYPPYPEEFIGREIVIYRDPESEVSCNVVNTSAVTFHNRKVLHKEMKFEDIPEHYGMNLITKFSHGTDYYRENNGTDCFRVRKKLR